MTSVPLSDLSSYILVTYSKMSSWLQTQLLWKITISAYWYLLPIRPPNKHSPLRLGLDKKKWVYSSFALYVIKDIYSFTSKMQGVACPCPETALRLEARRATRPWECHWRKEQWLDTALLSLSTFSSRPHCSRLAFVVWSALSFLGLLYLLVSSKSSGES